MPAAKVDGRDYEKRAASASGPASIHPGQDGADHRAAAAADVASCWPTPAPISPGSATIIELEEGQNFRKPGTFGPMAGHVNGAIGLKLAHPDRAVVVGCGDGCYSLSGFELMTAVEHNMPVVWVIFNDGEFKLIKLYQLHGLTARPGWSSSRTPTSPPTRAPAARTATRSQTIEEFEDAYRRGAGLRAAHASSTPGSRGWALPHYSPSPRGTIAGVLEMLEDRLRDGLAARNEGKP